MTFATNANGTTKGRSGHADQPSTGIAEIAWSTKPKPYIPKLNASDCHACFFTKPEALLSSSAIRVFIVAAKRDGRHGVVAIAVHPCGGGKGPAARRWIPELASSPDQAILDPTIGRRAKQLALPLFAGADYPLPILDHERAARAFLEPYQREVIPA